MSEVPLYSPLAPGGGKQDSVLGGCHQAGGTFGAEACPFQIFFLPSGCQIVFIPRRMGTVPDDAAFPLTTRLPPAGFRAGGVPPGGARPEAYVQ